MNYHIPILTKETIAFAKTSINNKTDQDAIVIDGTLGDGGHSLSLLTNFPNIKLLGIDRDNEMIERVQKRFQKKITNFIY